MQAQTRYTETARFAFRLRDMQSAKRRRAISGLKQRKPNEFARWVQQLKHDWTYRARTDQLPPDGDWSTWLVLAGRGWGKTRTGAEWVRYLAESGRAHHIALVAPTAADARDVMVEGPSGIMRIAPDWTRPTYEPSKRRVTWPNGAIAHLYSADEPDRLRGPQHDAAWCDELAAWRRPNAWDMMLMGLRIGSDPRCVVTTTPRPTRIIRDLIDAETTHVTRGSTYDNLRNLAPVFRDVILKRYEGTRLGRQELYAEILDDVPGALWKRDAIDSTRVANVPELIRVVVAVDPAVTSHEGSDETGIVVAGVAGDGHLYVLEDCSCREGPEAWATRVVSAFDRWQADRVVAEVNNGGDLVEANLRTIRTTLPMHKVRAARGKVPRAEPVASLYEQARAHHVGMFHELEDQMCTYVPGDESPDRMDALVWAARDLEPEIVKDRAQAAVRHEDLPIVSELNSIMREGF